MSPVMLDLLINAIEDTLLMTAISGLISLVAGLPLGLILVMTSPGRESLGQPFAGLGD
jgi:D-methionine transport system permease protein